MAKTFKLSLFIGFMVLVLSQCKWRHQEPIPDVSAIPVNIKIDRFEQALFEADTNNFDSDLRAILKTYPEFGSFFFDRVLRLERLKVDSSMYTRAIRDFVTFDGVRALYDTCSVVFVDVSDIEAQLTDAFRRLKYYLPDWVTPSVLSCISEYSVGTYTYGDSLLVIGWDFFLGMDYPYYNPSIFPNYIRKTMQPAYVPIRAVEAYMNNNIPNPGTNNLLSLMLYNGKKAYIRKKALPYVADSLLWAFTSDQYTWCSNNELEMWSHFLNEDLLYSTDINKISKLVNPSPNSPGMPAEAPGQTANFIGMKIIESFMNRNPDTTLESLISMADPQELLNKSRYKPKR